MLFTAVGVQENVVDSDGVYRVRHGGYTFYLPELIFLFWEQFLDGTHYDEARESFEQTGLSAELFNEFLGVLVRDGLIVCSGDER